VRPAAALSGYPNPSANWVGPIAVATRHAVWPVHENADRSGHDGKRWIGPNRGDRVNAEQESQATAVASAASPRRRRPTSETIEFR